MDVLMPRSLDEALAMKAARPAAVPIAGGTDLMVAVNFGQLRPEAFLDVSRLTEPQQIRRGDRAGPSTPVMMTSATSWASRSSGPRSITTAAPRASTPMARATSM